MTISALLSDPGVRELVNHLWQSSVIVGIAWAIATLLKKNRARVRYWVWFATSVKFLVPSSVLFAAGQLLRSWIPTPPVHPGLARAFEPLTQLPVGQTSDADFVEIHHPNWVLGLLLAIWMSGVLVVIARSVRAWLRVHAAKRSGKPMELLADVPVIVSRSKIEPGIIGIFRPVLLLPEGLLSHVSTVQLRAIVSHEMCHVRRRDNLTFALHMFTEALFWFYPIVWWIGRRLIDERNRACQTGTNRITQAEISNLLRQSFPGRVNRPKFPTSCGRVFRGGSLRENSSFPWLSFSEAGQRKQFGLWQLIPLWASCLVHAHI